MPDSIEPVTLGEVYRRLTQMENRMDTGFQAVNRTIADSAKSYVHLDRYVAERSADEARVKAVEDDISEIKANNKWRDRTLFGMAGTLIISIVTGVIVLLIGIGIGR